MTDYPFLRAEFLDALETSGSVGKGTGWEPEHLELRQDGQVLATMPLYRKEHSWGEYVFDWAWADAYRRHGLRYYPKLLTAIPFTPATGPRIALDPGCDPRQAGQTLASQAIDLTRELGASGWHLLFPDADTMAMLADEPLMRRTGVQYHWFNRQHGDFEDFLDSLVARKRKMVRRERRRVREQGLRVERLRGAEITPAIWDLFYGLYQQTYLKRSGNGGYLTREFFLTIAETMADQIIMATAFVADEPVACALYFEGADTLFGRYWGCRREYDCLHFELCYYQGIEHAISRGLQKFDAGAQGEHKILRGFEPVETYSLHWIAEPAFAEAIGRFLDQERREIMAYIRRARTILPYRQS